MKRLVQRRRSIRTVPASTSPRSSVRPGPQIHPVSSTGLGMPRVPAIRIDVELVASLRGQAEGAELSRPLIVVVVPVLRRPHRVAPLVESFRAATTERDARLLFVAQASDGLEIDAIARAGLEPLVVGDGDRSWAKKINRGYEASAESWILLGADDLRFHPGWVDSIRPLLSSHHGVIGTNDLGNVETMRGRFSTHPLVRRLYADVCGTLDERRRITHEGYDHNFPDTELVMTARARGLYMHCTTCYIEHLHPLWGKGVEDEIYQLGRRNFHRDQKLFEARTRVLHGGR
mgnify:CR=1 FL=1